MFAFRRTYLFIKSQIFFEVSKLHKTMARPHSVFFAYNQVANAPVKLRCNPNLTLWGTTKIWLNWLNSLVFRLDGRPSTLSYLEKKMIYHCIRKLPYIIEFSYHVTIYNRTVPHFINLRSVVILNNFGNSISDQFSYHWMQSIARCEGFGSGLDSCC